jgi:hypothetical protein
VLRAALAALCLDIIDAGQIFTGQPEGQPVPVPVILLDRQRQGLAFHIQVLFAFSAP